MQYIVTVSGPAQKYRLDLIKECFPSILNDLVTIFTDRYSYNLYKDYHKYFNFVIIDEYRSQYQFSLENEKFYEVSLEEDYWKNLTNFYSKESGLLYPYEIQRFIFPYLIERNITSFALIDSDVILNNDRKLHQQFFSDLPNGCFYSPFQGELNSEGQKTFLSKNVDKHFPSLDLSQEYTTALDGWIRGFNFRNTSDMKLFFEVWNKSLELLYTSHKNQFFTGCVIVDFNFLCGSIMGTFMDYKVLNSSELNLKYPKKLFYHISRVEDNLYWDRYGQWSHFDYSDTSSISNFIQNNKEKLLTYYSGPFNVKLTNTHIFTYLK